MAVDFAQSILTWYKANKRNLPWRNISDPYRIWVSEIILQQTRIAQGYDYYLQFVQAFPTVSDLAQSSEDEVLRLWQGLGYYSRARNLRAAAQTIAKQFNGIFPNNYTDVLSLKGVGTYTAAAICSFAFNQPYAVVDGNVYRVLSRYYGIDLPIDTTNGKKYFAQLAQQLLPQQQSADYNQGLMDFGAMQCTPMSPQCIQCILSSSCVAYNNKCIESYPIKSKKIKTVNRYFVYLKIETPLGVWLHRRSKQDIWKGLYEFPLLEFDKKPTFDEIVNHPFIKSLCMKGAFKMLKQNMKHVLTHQIIYADYYQLRFETNLTPPSNYFTVELSKINEYAMPQLLLKLIE